MEANKEAERRRLISPQRLTVQTAVKTFYKENNWWVRIKIEKPPITTFFKNLPFETQEAADQFHMKYEGGFPIVDVAIFRNPTDEEVKHVQILVDTGQIANSLYFSVTLDYELPALILEVCKIIDAKGNPTRKVFRLLGAQRLRSLKAMNPKVWHHAAVMEYAMRSLSTDSPAYIAASVLYHSHVSNEFALSGYFLRDLVAIFHRTDQVYINEMHRQKNSGEAGTEKTAEAIAEKRKTLISRMGYLLKNEKNTPSEKPLTPELLGVAAARHLRRYKNKYWLKGDEGSIDGHLTAVRSKALGPSWVKKLQNIEQMLINLNKTNT